MTQIKSILALLILFLMFGSPAYTQKVQVVGGPDPYQSELVPVQKNEKWGFKNAKDQLIIDYKYDEVNKFQSGVAVVEIDGQSGLINIQGKILIPFGKYESIYLFQEGYAKVRSHNSLFGFINKKGEQITSCKFESADFFRGGLAEVQKNNKWGYIDTTGSEVVPIIYDQTKPLMGGEIEVKKDGKWGILDRDGSVLVKPVFEEINPPREGMRLVKKDGKYGYLNSNNHLVIECKYDKAYPFTNGKAFIQYDDRYGTVDKTGKETLVEE